MKTAQVKQIQAHEITSLYSEEESKRYLWTLLRCAVVGIDGLEADERSTLLSYYEVLCGTIDGLYDRSDIPEAS